VTFTSFCIMLEIPTSDDEVATTIQRWSLRSRVSTPRRTPTVRQIAANTAMTRKADGGKFDHFPKYPPGTNENPLSTETVAAKNGMNATSLAARSLQPRPACGDATSFARAGSSDCIARCNPGEGVQA
jgi:hypothetical protein